MNQEVPAIGSFKRVFVANRGEIAIRIAKAATTLGIESVGVHVPVDAGSLHTRYTSENREIGSSLAIKLTPLVRIWTLKHWLTWLKRPGVTAFIRDMVFFLRT